MTQAATGNAADRKQVVAAAKIEKRTRDQELRDLRWVLQALSGRRFYWRLLESCGAFKISYTRGDPYETCFREGERNIGLKLLTDLMEADPEAYMKMKEENQEETDDRSVNPGKDGAEDGTETGAEN